MEPPVLGLDVSVGALEHVSAFLFTDIEGSTDLWERDAALMSSALAEHDRLLAEVMSANSGTIFSHMGDGIAVAFPTCSEAVAAAIDAQRVFALHEWPPACVLRIRAGVHTGPYEARNNDYFGRTLNWTARIMAAAHAGQVLVSRAVCDALEPRADPLELRAGGGLGDGLGDGPGQPTVGVAAFGFRNEGVHRLRGISQAVELVTVLAPDLPHEFPPLRTVKEATSMLPLALNELVGRDEEVGVLLELIASNRLVTVTGTGGSGKTRLALEVASTAVDRFPGGVQWVELAPVADGTAVMAAIAESVLGVDALARPGSELERLVTATSAGTLLVLDNCEHVVDAVADAVAALLARSATLVVLATSREPLTIGGEQLVPVQPLVADDDDPSSSAAVRLFVQRARAAAPNSPSLDLATVALICRRLDGLPLAIELAAARLRVVTLNELSQRLFEVLHANRRDRRRADRHSTMDAAIEWSYSLLDPDEQRVLARASVFVGTFDLEAAAAVCGGHDHSPIEVMEILGSLIDRSLVSVVYVESGNRFRLLEVIRAFAAERVAPDVLDTLRSAHQQHYVTVTAALVSAFELKPDAMVIAALEVDVANVGAALRHRQTTDHAKTARKLLLQLHAFFEETGRLRDGYAHCRELLEPREPNSRLWRSLLGLSVIYGVMLGDHRAPSEEAELAGLLDGAPDIVATNSYLALGFANLARGRFPEARSWFEVAAEALLPLDQNGQRNALMTAGACAAYDERPQEALRSYAAAHGRPGTPQGWFEAYHRVFVSSALVQLDPSSAPQHIGPMVDALERLVELGFGFRVTVAVHQAAVAFEMAGDQERFNRWWPVALRMARENWHLWAVALGVELSAWSAAHLGDDEVAAQRWGLSRAAFESAGFDTTPLHRTLWRPIEAGLRDRLGDRFEAAVRVGRTLDLASFAPTATAAQQGHE